MATMNMPIPRFKRGSKKMQYLVDQYRRSHPNDGPDIDPHLIARWAIKEGLWRPTPISEEEQLRRLISRSLRETYIVDPQGREVRANLPLSEEVMTSEGPKRRSRWYPLFDAPASVARASFSLRRRLAFADVSQLHFDFLSWNENNKSGDVLEPMDFNFNEDLAEISEPTEYPEGPEDDDDDPNYA